LSSERPQLSPHEEALDQLIVSGSELEDNIKLGIAYPQDVIKLGYLRPRAGISVEYKPLLGVVGRKPIANHTGGDSVRYEIAGVHVLFGLEARLSFPFHVVAEDVPCGNGNDAEAFGNPFRLRSLARSRRTDK
jgi:hypothetical protein